MDRLFVLALLVSVSIQVRAAEYFVLPVAVRLEGVGGIFGIAAGSDKIFSERTKIVAGATLGGVGGAGMIVSDIPLGFSNFGLNLAYANIQKARFQSSYARGLNQTNTFGQEIAATGYGATIDWLTINKTLKFSVGIVLSEILLKNFYLDGHRITRPNTSGYHPIRTTAKVFSVNWDQSDRENHQGFKLGVGLTTAEGRAGQSDMLISNWQGSYYVPLRETITWALHARWSDAYITKKASRYTDVTSVKGALSTNCASIVDAADQARCQLLEDSIAEYVAHSNSAGTAAPIGGHNGLRAYDELSVRAAHTRLFSTELRWQLTQIGSVPIALTPFYDLGWGADEARDVFKRNADSYGVGLRAVYNSMPLRLAFARTQSQSAWFFTLGHAF